MKPIAPQSLHGAPGFNGYQPSATPISRTEDARVACGLPRTVPTLTIYADGNANLNNEAAALLGLLPHGAGVDLHEPAPHRTNAGNPRRPNLWSVSGGTSCKLLPRADRGACRFRVSKSSPPAGRYVLAPLAGQPEHYTLVPL